MGLWRISYLITRGDLAMPEGLMTWLVERAREHGAEVQTKTIESGHFVQISHADEVAEWVSKLCVEGRLMAANRETD